MIEPQDINAEGPVNGFEIKKSSPFKLIGEFRVWDAHKNGEEYVLKIEDRESVDMLLEQTISLAMDNPCVSKVVDYGTTVYLKKYFVYRKFPLCLEELDRTAHLDFPQIQNLMGQLMKGLRHIHSQKYIHCAIQPANIMIEEMEGGEKRLIIHNFAFSQSIQEPVENSTLPLGYQPIEILISRQSNAGVDMWSAGCVMARMIRRCELFNGENHESVLQKMATVLGRPLQTYQAALNAFNVTFETDDSPKIRQALPGVSDDAINLIEQLLAFDPIQRPSPIEALKHSYFTNDESQVTRTDLTLPDFP